MDRRDELEKKVRSFIKYCNCISEFDKYFWLSKLENYDSDTLEEIYETLLESENKLVDLELESIGNIRNLIINSYPELTEKFLPDYGSLMRDFRTIQYEMTGEKLEDLRERLTKLIHNKN